MLRKLFLYLPTTSACVLAMSLTADAQGIGSAIGGALNPTNGGQVGGGVSGALGGTNAGVSGNANANTTLGGQIGNQVGQAIGNAGNRAAQAVGGAIDNATGAANTQVNGQVNASNNMLPNVQNVPQNILNNLQSSISSGQNGFLQLDDTANSTLKSLGFQNGDQIVGADGQVITDSNALNAALNNQSKAQVLRNGEKTWVNLNSNTQASTNSNANGTNNAAMSSNNSQSSDKASLGIVMDPQANGVFISQVTPNSAAAQAGLKAGDTIVSVNGNAVNNPDEMIKQIQGAKVNDQVKLVYNRNGQQMGANATLQAAASQNRMSSNMNGYGQSRAASNRNLYRPASTAVWTNNGWANAQVTSGQDRLESLENSVSQLTQQIQQLRDEIKAMQQK